MLTKASLAKLAARGIHTPRYRHTKPPAVVHLGLGAFHRAHQALVFDDLLSSCDPRWGVFGVAMHNPAIAAALEQQDRLYAVRIASANESHWRVCGAIAQSCVAAQSPESVVRAIAADSTRWITLTVTEKAYAAPLAGLLVRGLAVRRAAGLGGLTIASCDNLSGNGRQLQALCARAAHEHDSGFAHWITEACAFPNSMVDRIVPAASEATTLAARDALGVSDQAALRTEAFWEWVIERRFVDATDGATLQSAGVQVVDDVAPFEVAKLRLLNGAHSALACVGAVAGLPVISECICQAVLHRFIHAFMTLEVGPLLQRPGWQSYRDALLTRFANSSLQHSVHQIASDSSQKIPQRWVPSALDALANGIGIDHLAFAAAAWMRFCLGHDEAGTAYAMHDPLADTLRALANAHKDDAHATFGALGTLDAVWGNRLPHQLLWRDRVINHLQAIRANGVLDAAARLQTH
ncbi:MAG: mannitol dehydrogenase family protein [Burkholderiaceae bacterium]